MSDVSVSVSDSGGCVELVCGNYYLLVSAFGIFDIESVGDASVWSIFRLPFFKSVGDKCILFGVDWHGCI